MVLHLVEALTRRLAATLRSGAQQAMEVDSGKKVSKKVAIGLAGRVPRSLFSSSWQVREIAIG